MERRENLRKILSEYEWPSEVRWVHGGRLHMPQSWSMQEGIMPGESTYLMTRGLYGVSV